MNNYWFFFSYAKRDAKDSVWLKRFYEDMASEIARIVGLRASIKEKEIGFIDEEGIETGDEWPEVLADALQSSRVFICIYSASYFNSRFCGKEFEVFRSRVNEYTRSLSEHAEPPRLIIPVLWERPIRLPQPLPDAVTDIQYTHADLGELYAREGLRYIIRMGRDSEYQQFIMNFAERVVNQARTHQLQRLEEIPPLRNVNSAFHPVSSQALPSTPPQITSLVKGPQAAWFVYVAGRGVELRSIRQVVDCYGQSGGRDWRPYLPISDATVGLIVQRVATSKGLLIETLPLNEQLITQLREAEESNTLVIIVVDPWSIHVESYQRPMEEYDRRRLVNCGVIIVWNDADSETSQHRDMLEATVRRIFSRQASSTDTDTYFRNAVRTEEVLMNELGDAIDELQTKIIKRAKLLRPVKSSGSSLPRINVPSVEAS